MEETKNALVDATVKTYEGWVLRDYWMACVSREASLLARKEVLTGKAKFGIVGDGKELPQIALAKVFEDGDWRSGYYRDQTLMFALGLCTVEDFFAQLYADPENDPFSGGRQMNGHFGSRLLDESGEWLQQTTQKNISSDISSTGGQMARALGLALASKKYREMPQVDEKGFFSHKGNEVVFCTIGDASTSEGVFWETLNAAAVMQVPMIVSVWDDGYGISVPIDYQTAKKSISKAAAGFGSDKIGEGIKIVTVKAWDYVALCQTYQEVTAHVRATQQPALIHVREVTQPQGHSTSGSHERYKSKERLDWELEFDCIAKMGDWLVEKELATTDELAEIRQNAKDYVRTAKENAWQAFNATVKSAGEKLTSILDANEATAGDLTAFTEARGSLRQLLQPAYHDYCRIARRLYQALNGADIPLTAALADFLDEVNRYTDRVYHRHLISETNASALRVPVVPAEYADDAPIKNGFEVLNAFFDTILEKRPEFLAFGEDVGQIGDVNQGFAGLQAKYGRERVFDAGIREWTIMGQAIGLGLRGWRPLAEIQYLDYLIYGLQPLTDDLATLRYRSNGQQKCPAIIRTRGHRLEGIWHAGSPMGMLIHSLRGMHVCVPRNMTQAAGMYNTLLLSDDPGLVIECLNGYRLKEKMPSNLDTFTVPLGVPEVMVSGEDVTLVTYGSCVRVAEEAVRRLQEMGISVELIDIQTLLPFDLEHGIAASLQKTNRLVILDEDVPGGASAYILQQVLEEQQGYQFLDSAPLTITASAHRPPYGSDGDYFSKPSCEDVCLKIHNLMAEAFPDRWARL